MATTREAIWATVIGTLTAATMAIGLALLANPGNLKARIAALQDQAQRTRSDLGAKPVNSLLPTGAICRDTESAAKALHDSVSAAAAHTGLSLEMIDARPDLAATSAARLSAVRLRFTATGSYEAVVGLLGDLSRQRPELFADNVDLVSKTSNVSLTFSGRAFCSA